MQFRTKARAVDLLGKGQIADLPTAITELWKNGYDAYADNVTAEIYLKGYQGLEQDYFLMTDDGKGMSAQDILEKWLVLGTDSKSRAKLEDNESIETLWKKPRIKAGEKGIGRLSVAYLGNPMLMLTKKLGSPLQAMFFDWRLLENFNLFLDDISIPVQEVDKKANFVVVFDRLKQAFLDNFTKNDHPTIWEASQQRLKNTIIDSVHAATIEPFIADDLLDSLLDIEDAHGTKFFIFEPIDQIIRLVSKDDEDLDDQHFLISSLSGFSNPFTKTEIELTTKFYIHKERKEEYDLLTSKGRFFSEEDYGFADVVIDGEFDGTGSFEGKIRIYDQEIEYSYTNPRKKDSRNFYGAIPIKLGYSQGEEMSSTLDSDTYGVIKDKVKSYGGLYIYRDNFRVLPYGRENMDFLGFESRRSRRAGEYYFSYRRMFGYLDLTRERNAHLKDKSSREGLINNSQYRAFFNDATAFFVQLAKDYFATNPKESLFLDKKDELNKQYKQLKVAQEKEKQAKRVFSQALTKYPERLKDYQNKYNHLLTLLESKLDSMTVSYHEIESIMDSLHQLDIEYNDLIPKIPKKYKPTDLQLDRLEKYSNLLELFQQEKQQRSAPLFSKVQEKLEIRELKIDFSKKFTKYKTELDRLIFNGKDQFTTKIRELTTEYDQRTKKLKEEFFADQNILLDNIDSKEKVTEYTTLIESRFKQSQIYIDNTLSPLIEHVKNLSFDLDEDLVQGAYKAEYDLIKYQWEQTRETAQLGIAVEIIDHEFNQLYAKINHSLIKLEDNSIFSSSEEFDFLTRSFKQLEDKYTLLSPLYRISGISAKEIKCADIADYLSRFFEKQLNGIELKTSDTFNNHTLFIKEPIIYTVLINIINNAIFWLKNAETKVIEFDYLIDTQEILILNSGEKIEEHRIDKIFDLFYSNRPNGRGIGLYLSRQSLNENGLSIHATNDKTYNKLNGACFVIKPQSYEKL